MDKNTITGLILIAVVLMGFSYCNQTGTEEAARQQAINDSIAKEEQKIAKEAEAAEAAAEKAKAEALAQDTTSLFAAQRVASNGTALAKETPKATPVCLKNGKVTVEIDPQGAMPARVQLNEYKSYTNFRDKKDIPLVLFDRETAKMDLLYETKEQNLTASDFSFEVVSQTDTTATLRLGTAERGLDYTYTLLKDNYMLNLTIKAHGLNNDFSAKTRTISLSAQDRVRQQEKGHSFENRFSQLTYHTDEDTEKLSEGKDEEENAEAPVDWVAFKNQYFSSVIISGKPMQKAHFNSVIEDKESGFLKNYEADAELAFDPTGKDETKLQFYFGPNNYRLLQTMENVRITKNDMELQTLVYLGWPLVRWINRFFTLYVFDFLTKMGLPMGVVLLLITLLLRIIVYGPTKKSFLSSAKMRVLKPKMDEITKKYPNQEDAMKRQQEMMSLQSQYGVSPMGGCLPMLIQMPIWIAMFNFVPNAIELRQQSLLWAEDLSTYDSLLSWDTPIFAIGDHLSLFCLLFCATNIVYSYLTMRQQRDSMAMAPEQASQMKIMRWMMYLMPVFFFFMFNEYSAGLNFYYFISLLFSAITMWYLRATTDDAKLLEKLEENYRRNKENPNKKPTGFAARLAALQEEQQKKLEEKQARYKK